MMTEHSEHYADLESLRQAVKNGARPSYVLFWGHRSKARFAIGKECLSQWYPARFNLDGREFTTAEHSMMFHKAQLFGDEETAQKILHTPDPGAAKALGRSVRGFDDELWQQRRFEIAVAGNFAKFSQAPTLSRYLLSTAPQVLVEASPVDNIWGIGLAAENPQAQDPTLWLGLNLLGFALMEARRRLAG